MDDVHDDEPLPAHVELLAWFAKERQLTKLFEDAGIGADPDRLVRGLPLARRAGSPR